MKIKLNSISFKIGMLFSGVFIVLFLSLGAVLYEVFTNTFVDYIQQDLVARGNNYSKILEGMFDRTTINHVITMEKGVITDVVITDINQKVVASSINIDRDMKEHFLSGKSKTSDVIIENDWRRHQYIISVSRIGNGKGYVYMYYPSYILRNIVYVINIFIILASFGIIFLAFGLIGVLSRRIAKPLLAMNEATNNLAIGKYKQSIPVKGNDEISQLGNSIQLLGEQLQYFENSRNEFLSAVSHELRTPLTYIKGYSGILLKGFEGQKEQEDYLKIINKEAKRVSFLVNDLFEMSKLQVGAFQLEKEWTKVNPIIEKVISSLKPAAANKDIKLNQCLQVENYLVNIDTNRMEQVLYNLIENAIKYTNIGAITVRSYKRKEFTVVEIEDTGIGIPSDDLPKVWDRFYRVDQSRTRKTGGTGLGLYVVKNIVEAHDGKIIVKSIEGHGSTFTIFLKNKKQSIPKRGE